MEVLYNTMFTPFSSADKHQSLITLLIIQKFYSISTYVYSKYVFSDEES